MNKILLVLLTLIFSFNQSVQAADTFNFNTIEDIQSMAQYIKDNFDLGDDRTRFRKTFVGEGKA